MVWESKQVEIWMDSRNINIHKLTDVKIENEVGDISDVLFVVGSVRKNKAKVQEVELAIAA